MAQSQLLKASPTINVGAFRFATIYQSEHITVVIAAPSIQQLAAAWRTIAQSKLDPSKVDKIEILPQ